MFAPIPTFKTFAEDFILYNKTPIKYNILYKKVTFV